MQTDGYRDVKKKLPMERESICRIYSISTATTRCINSTNAPTSGAAPAWAISSPRSRSFRSSNRAKGFGLGVEVSLDPGRGAVPTSVGQFGWYGAATTYCQIDPKEHLVAVAFAQHFPFNEHNFFAKWATAYYQALK